MPCEARDRSAAPGAGKAASAEVDGGEVFLFGTTATSSGALDASGWWAVVLGFEGEVRCARFADVREEALPRAPWPGVPATSWTSSLSRSAYVAGVGRVREGIAVGDYYQVNLCRVLSAPVPGGADPAGLAGLLARGNPAPYAGAVVLPDHDLAVVSASPELFLRRAGDVVESGPIKGTAPTADELTAKDHAENVMIVDLVRNDLGRVCEFGSVRVPSLCRVEAHPGRALLRPQARGAGPDRPAHLRLAENRGSEDHCRPMARSADLRAGRAGHAPDQRPGPGGAVLDAGQQARKLRGASGRRSGR